LPRRYDTHTIAVTEELYNPDSRDLDNFCHVCPLLPKSRSREVRNCPSLSNSEEVGLSERQVLEEAGSSVLELDVRLRGNQAHE